LILGLTGGYCTGKSTAAAILEADGWKVVNVDLLGHRALEPRGDIRRHRTRKGAGTQLPDRLCHRGLQPGE